MVEVVSVLWPFATLGTVATLALDKFAPSLSSESDIRQGRSGRRGAGVTWDQNHP